MRLFISLLSALLVIAFSSTIYAKNNKSDLFDGCIKRKKSETYCNCAVGKPYDELVSKNVNQKMDSLTTELEKLKAKHIKLHDQDISKGGLNPAQIKRICIFVDEYYQFMDDMGIPYKRVGKKNLISSSNKNMTPMTNDIRQAMVIKRREVNKKIHDLNNEYQRSGAMGSFATLSNGACYIDNQIKWIKEEIEKQKKEVKPVSVNIGLRDLLGYAQKSCGDL